MRNIGKFKYAFGGHLKGEESPSGLYPEYMECAQQRLGVCHMGKFTERLRRKVDGHFISAQLFTPSVSV